MPIYEFKCTTCQAEFETLVGSFDQVHTVRCQHCGSADVSRLLSTVNSKVKKAGSAPKPPPNCRAKSGFS